MDELVIFGRAIKEKRLSLNLRMDDVAERAGITRATLYAIEKGSENYTVSSLLKVIDVLGMSLEINSDQNQLLNRDRASRANTVLDKKINRFVIMCIEQYAYSVKKSSSEIYKRMLEKGVLEELTNDYEDLHGMSTLYINEYINSLLEA